MKLEIKSNDLDVLLGKLERVRLDAVPFAVRDSLNASAFFTKREWTGEIHRRMTVRNTWTQRGIKTRNATGKQVSRMESVVGSVRSYMSKLEEGGTVSDARGVPIHTSVASGEGRGARPRTKVVRPGNRLNKIQRYTGRGGTQRQKNADAVRQAQRGGGRSKVAYMEVGARKGLYKVSGSKKNPKIDLIIDLTRISVRVPAHPTLEPTLEKVNPRLATLHALAIVRQLRRQGWL